ncbi:MAG: HEAT repeat domain-containing protein [Opitutia bacterium]
MARASLALLLLAASAQALPEGFVIRDFVGPDLEPELYPTAITAAPDGDVYISSDRNGSLGHGKDMGRILIARDKDADGKADQLIEFTKADSPRGGHYVGGVLYLIHPPFLTAFRDKTGDGKSDEKLLLVEGLGAGIEHPRGADHTTNGVRMGIDGWLYISVGDFGAGIEREKDGAKGRDGRRVTLHGGGVIRVRPDGTEMELYAEMTRNQCDTAISPLLDLFTRDNTNDGKGWNTRFHHHTALANHGYPRLYKNFPDETVGFLADYGGGSGTGALYLSEPGFPAGWGETLFTCDWTTGTIHNHPLKPFEASFVAQQQTFQKVRHATDIDVDGNSRLYISDWRAGGYNYLGKGKPQGRIQQVVAPGVKPNRYVDVTKASPADLVRLLASESSVQRLEASRRILDLRLTAQADAILALAADTQAHLYHRVAAVFTYKQLLGAKSTDGLVRLTRDAKVREFALRALADRLGETKGVPTEPFVQALADPDPRVRLQAAIGLQRLGARDAAPALLAAAADWSKAPADAAKGENLRLPHTAVQVLARLGNVPALLAAARQPAQRETALRALQMIHSKEAVDGALALSESPDPALRAAAIGALARLYHREKPWNYKDWWHTRPDDRGPYFEPAEWELTPRIRAGIEAAFPGLPAAARPAALQVLAKNRIAVADLKLGDIDALQILLAKLSPTQADATLLKDAALSAKRPWDERLACLGALRRYEGKDALSLRVQVLAAWSKESGAPAAAEQAIGDFVNDAQRGNEVAQLRALANGAEDAVSRVLWRSLLTVLNSPLAKDAQKAQVRKEIDKNPREIGFFLAIADLRVGGFDQAIDAAIAGDNVQLINAAKAAREAGKAAAAHAGKKVGEMPAAEALAAALRGKGDIALGKRLYVQQGCIACHSVDPAAEQKGPYLGAAGAKFSREYLIESILEPGKVVAQGFQTAMFRMKDGSSQIGFVVGEADGVVSLRNIAGVASTLRRADVAEQTILPQSLMPAGLAANLSAEEFTALIEYLVSLRATGG